MSSPLKTNLTYQYPMTENGGNRVATVGTSTLTQTGTVSRVASTVESFAAHFTGSNANYLRDNSAGIKAAFTNWAGDWTLLTRINITSSFSTQCVLSVGDNWLGEGFYLGAIGGTNFGVVAGLDNSTTTGTGTTNTNTLSTGWHWVMVRHDSVNRKLTMFIDGRVFRGSAYASGRTIKAPNNIGFSVGLLNRGDSAPGTNPLNGDVEAITIIGRAVSDLEYLGWYNAGQGLAIANWDSQFPDLLTVPSVDFTRQVFAAGVGSVLNSQQSATIDGAAGTDTTGHIKLVPRVPIISPTFLFANAVAYYNGAGNPTNGEDVGTTPASLTVSASAYLVASSGTSRDAAVTNMTFSSNPSKLFAWGDVQATDTVNFDGRCIFPNESVEVNYKINPASGTAVAGTRQLSSASGDGTVTGDHLADVSGTAFVNHKDVYFFAPVGHMGYASWAPNTEAAADVIQIGDSISADASSAYWPRALSATAARYLAIGSSGEALADLIRTAGGLARRQIIPLFSVLAFQYGINDCRTAAASFSFATFKANLKTVISLAASGSCRKVLLTCLTPISDTGNTSYDHTINRNLVNNWYLGNDSAEFLTSATVSAWLGLPVVLWRWNNGTGAWVSQGSRGTQVGKWVDVYIIDRVNASIETGFPAVGGLWVNANQTVEFTSGPGGTPAPPYIHPTTTTHTQIISDIAPQLSAALTASPPAGQNAAPTVASASVDSTGAVLTVNFNVPGTSPLLPSSGITGFALSGGHSLGSGTRTSNTQVQFPILSAVQGVETVTLSATGNNLTDTAGTPLADFSGQAVTNNSTVAGRQRITRNDGVGSASRLGRKDPKVSRL